MDLFVSKYFNKIDKKGRISLPSSFRNVLPKANRNEIILYKSIKSPSIEGCGVGRLKEIAKRINNLDFFSEDYDDFSTSIFSEIVRFVPNILALSLRPMPPPELFAVFCVNETFSIKGLDVLFK